MVVDHNWAGELELEQGVAHSLIEEQGMEVVHILAVVQDLVVDHS